MPQPIPLSPFWHLPLAVILLLVAAMLLLGHEAGVQLRRRTSRNASEEHKAEAIGSSYLTASLGLLALLVAFSFSMAVDRYNTRSALVREEANQMSTVWRKLETLPLATRAPLVVEVAAYAEARWAFSTAHTPQEIIRTEVLTDERQATLWTAAAAAGSGDFAVRSLLDSLNSLFNVAALRRDAIESVIPRTVLLALLLYAIIAAVFMGYSHPVRRRFFIASTVQFVLLALAFTLVIDLDRPRTGLVQISQEPLHRVVARIRTEAQTVSTAPLPPPAG